LNSYQYTNIVEDATSIACDIVDPDRIYDIARNGIGVRIEPAEGGTVEGTAYQFFYKASTAGSAILPGWYFIVLSDVWGFASRLVTLEVGPVVQLNTTYTFNIDAEEITYVSTVGQTDTAVRNALVTAINGATWDHTVTATAVGSNQLTVLIDDNTVICFSSRSLTQFKSGLYVEFALNGGLVKEYLIESNTSGSGYPVIDTIDSSYLYDDLTLAPAGMESLLYTPDYVQDSYFLGTSGSTDVTDTPEIVLPAAGRCCYADGMIYFGSPSLNVGERIKMITI
jgi:hypothetical protein